MIHDQGVAKEALQVLKKADGLLSQSLALVRERSTLSEYNEFRGAMAQVKGRLFFLVMEPIYRNHPSLAPADTPKEFRDSWSEGT